MQSQMHPSHMQSSNSQKSQANYNYQQRMALVESAAQALLQPDRKEINYLLPPIEMIEYDG